MAYILPRAIIVLIGWGMTCGIIANVWSHADPMVFIVAAASWAAAGAVCFGYMHKLRRETVNPRSLF